MSGRIALLILALVLLTGQQPVRSQSKGSPGFDLIDKAGNIRKPSDVRDLYQLLGTYTVELDPKGEEMHVTYASPSAAQYYRRNGKFADGKLPHIFPTLSSVGVRSRQGAPRLEGAVVEWWSWVSNRQRGRRRS